MTELSSDADDDSNINEFAEAVETGDHFDDFDMAAISATSGDNQMMYDNPISDQIDRTALMRTFLMELNQSSTGFDSPYMTQFNETIPPPPNYVKIVSVFMCNVFGCLCLLLNLFVIFALLRNRRRVLRNVFYVLVLHCAIVDLIRGTCLIAWGMPHLIINNMHSMRHRLLALKINQFTLVILRSCNLLTIFNLLVFTTNEFIVIKYPLHYRRCFRRRTVLCILGASWIISLFFGIGSVFSNFFESAHSVMVLSSQAYMFRNASGVPPTGVTRRELAGVSINVVFMLIIFVLCYLCLLTVLICYGTILRTIRRFHGGDDKGRFHSEESQKITKNSIYCRHDDSTKTNASSTFGADGTPTNGNVDHNVSKRCSSHRKWRSHLMSRHKYLIVIGSVLFVDVLFLFPYSGIQMVAFLHLNNMLSTSPMSTMIRWGLQILIGIHSVMQPLCYFRMNEFRRLACCGNSKQLNRSKSFSQTKDQLATNDDEIIALRDNQSRELVCEPLINARGDAAESDDEVPVAVTPSPVVIVNSPRREQHPTTAALASTKLEMQFLEHNWNRVGSSKFRRHGPPSRDEEDGPTQKLSGEFRVCNGFVNCIVVPEGLYVVVIDLGRFHFPTHLPAMSDLPLPYQSPPAAGKNLREYIEEEHAILQQNMEALLSLGDKIGTPVGAELNARLGRDAPIVEYIKLMQLRSDLPIEVLTERRLKLGLIVGKEIDKHWIWVKDMGRLTDAFEHMYRVSYGLVKGGEKPKNIAPLSMEAFKNPSKKADIPPPPPPPQPIPARPATPEPSEAEPASSKPSELSSDDSKPSESMPEPPKPSEAPIIAAEESDDDPIDENATQKAFLDMLARDFERKIYVLKRQEKDKMEQLASCETGSSVVCPTNGFTLQEHHTISSCAMVDRQAEIYTHVWKELYEIRRQLKVATFQAEEVAKRKRDLNS
uniref:G_PROTEIN_RECEP_F1_2 domain-containing protein n=1 Tax=Panagrellus redivivus TaxID=6233 RepID=A0A7E4VRX8_PANRE